MSLYSIFDGSSQVSGSEISDELEELRGRRAGFGVFDLNTSAGVTTPKLASSGFATVEEARQYVVDVTGKDNSEGKTPLYLVQQDDVDDPLDDEEKGILAELEQFVAVNSLDERYLGDFYFYREEYLDEDWARDQVDFSDREESRLFGEVPGIITSN